MASNSFFTGGGGSSDQNRNQQDQQITTGSCRPRKKSCSKSSTEINKKKTPRRGMGVEKLEELERLNNNNNNNINNKTASCSLSSLPYAFIPTGFVADPSGVGNGTISPLPMIPFSKYGAGMGAGSGGGGCLSLIPPVQQFMGITGAGGRAFYPNIGQGLQDISVDHLKGNSRELPSIPNLMQYCDFCPDCSKKKRPVRYACNKMVFDGVNPSFQEGAKVVALHRSAKASTMGRENQVVMEYDFFPEGRKSAAAAGKSKIHEEDEELMMMVGGGGSSRGVVVQGGGAGGGGGGGGGGGEAAASCLTTTTGTGTGTGTSGAADDASTYIDLSLKLSY